MLKIQNAYGTFDLTHSTLPKGYCHVKGARLRPLCKKHNIKCVPAVVGWDKPHKRYPARPIMDGVIVTVRPLSVNKIIDGTLAISDQLI